MEDTLFSWGFGRNSLTNFSLVVFWNCSHFIPFNISISIKLPISLYWCLLNEYHLFLCFVPILRSFYGTLGHYKALKILLWRASLADFKLIFSPFSSEYFGFWIITWVRIVRIPWCLHTFDSAFFFAPQEGVSEFFEKKIHYNSPAMNPQISSLASIVVLPSDYHICAIFK